MEKELGKDLPRRNKFFGGCVQNESICIKKFFCNSLRYNSCGIPFIPSVQFSGFEYISQNCVTTITTYFRTFSSQKEIPYSLSSHSHSLCPQLGETTNFLSVSKDLLLWTFNISKIIQCMIFYN